MHILNVPACMKGFSQPVTDLWREDVVGHIPDSLRSVQIGVAHSFHFAEDGAHCCVCGLVAFLVDEHPPVRDTESILSGLSAPQTPTPPQPSNHPTPQARACIVVMLTFCTAIPHASSIPHRDTCASTMSWWSSLTLTPPPLRPI